MKNAQQSPKNQNQNNNLHPISKKEEQLDKQKNKQEQKSDNTKKKDPELKEKELELKSKLLKKPKELLAFDANAHFKENISHTEKNCLEPITEKSYYCINCMHSECPLFKENENQKEHLLIKRAKCLFYDKNFFNSVENSINEALNFNQFKKSIKENMANSINSLKDELDKLKERKFQEIDTFFNETEKYLLDLKNKFLNAKQSIEDYYKVNKKFFNIELTKGTNSDSKHQNNEIKEKNVAKSQYINNDQQPHLNVNLDCIFESNNSNKDIENSVFLLNFELMNLCETKNLEIMDLINNLRIRILLFNDIIQKEYSKNLDLISKFFNIGMKAEKIDDYYWDIIMRIKKYSGMIQQFRETITDILHNAGNLEKIKDLIDIFDSKLKKNNKVIFEQNYFKENNDMNNNKSYRGPGSPNNERSTRKRNPSFSNTRSNSKSKLYSHRGKSAGKLKKADSKGQLTKNNYGTLTLSNDLGLMKLQENKNDNLKTESGSPMKPQGNLEPKKTAPISVFQRVLSYKNVVPEDIILDERVLERFFAYSVSELFSKTFIQLDPEDEANYIASNKDNIYLLRNLNNKPNLKNNLNPNNANLNNSQNNKLKKARGHSSKKNKNINYNSFGNKFGVFNNISNMKNANIFNNLKNSIGLNNNMLNNMNINNNSNNLDRFDSDKFDSNHYNIKSVSYLANYTNRYNSLKEIAKPIIGTNQIQLFTPNNQKIIRKTTSLNREEHGYSLFPEGCRHILIEDNLYIIGGTNHIRIPISIVLVYNITSGALKRISDLNTSHSYHTVEYLENYDSILCIGGENSSSCEIMNLENKKWYKLPSLNIPRANCNIYLNNITGELFVLFGICGIISEKASNYCDSIEVLVLNDISQGWIKIDYYKTPGLNLKVNYCMTIPFTRNQLLVYGGSNMRSFRQNIYALFHMIRNECIKVDTQTMELIKLEEKKSRLVDLALTKLG